MKQKKILIIDDDKLTLQVVKLWLKNCDHEIILADSGQKGIELAREETPHLILCDINMPEVNGYEVLKALRTDPSTAIIPFIFMTVKSGRESVRQGMEMGADDYITKPFDVGEFTEAVEGRLKKYALLSRYLGGLRRKISSATPQVFTASLSSILGFAEIIRDELQSDGPLRREKLLDYADSIFNEGQRLIGQAQKFEIFLEASLSAGDPSRVAELKSQELAAPRAVIERIVEETAGPPGRKQDITVEMEPASLRLPEHYFNAITRALAGNAVKHTPSGTPVKIEGKGAENFYQLAFSDKGPGIAEEELDNLKTFMQEEGKIYQRPISGMGLAIARIMTETCGGVFSISSCQGEGTSVILKIPVF